MKKSELRNLVKEEIQRLNEYDISHIFSVSLQKLIKKIKNKEDNIDKRMKDKSDGELLGMILTPIFQSALLDIKDRKGFKKNFKI
ncbi:MAG: hypothetical protein H8E13_12225 [Actinobacteria bacterium]|nr:hypothetical protein [Actinomycetota bacterium]